MLSVVIPAYNEEKMVTRVQSEVSRLLDCENIDYEIVFVDDGSKDQTWSEISRLCGQHSNTAAVSFSRNFGKEAAIFAGMEYARGDCCVVMDCDLQHPPEAIPQMYRLWQEGYEVVEGIKSSRGREGKLYKLAAAVFYSIIGRVTKIDAGASDFKLLDKKVVKELLNMPEKQFFFRAMSSWVGFKSTSVAFDVQEREAGGTKWSVVSLIKYAASSISSFTAAPMQMVTAAGLFFLLFSIIFGIQTLTLYAAGKSLEGFTTVIILLLIIGSILMISLGIIGYYLSKIYNEIKGRPRYIVARSLNQDGNAGMSERVKNDAKEQREYRRG